MATAAEVVVAYAIINESLTRIYIYKIPLLEVARGVVQERNEKHPAWNEYHYAGNCRMRVVF